METFWQILEALGLVLGAIALVSVFVLPFALSARRGHNDGEGYGA